MDRLRMLGLSGTFVALMALAAVGIFLLNGGAWVSAETSAPERGGGVTPPRAQQDVRCVEQVSVGKGDPNSLRTYNVSETADQIVLDLNLHGGELVASCGTLHVSWRTSTANLPPDTNTAGFNDFIPQDHSLEIGPGEYDKAKLVVPLLDDDVIEDNEFFAVQLYRAYRLVGRGANSWVNVRYAGVAGHSAGVRMTSDDDENTVKCPTSAELVGPSRPVREGERAQFTIQLDGKTHDNCMVEVKYRTGNYENGNYASHLYEDYVAVDETMWLPEGATSHTFKVKTLKDDWYEVDTGHAQLQHEAFYAELYHAKAWVSTEKLYAWDGHLDGISQPGALKYKRAFIEDANASADPVEPYYQLRPKVVFEKSSFKVREGETAQFRVNVPTQATLCNSFSVDWKTRYVAGQANPYPYPINGVMHQDYVAASGTLTWTKDDLNPKFIEVQTIGDQYREPEQVFEVELHNPQGCSLKVRGDTVATMRIQDPDRVSDEQQPAVPEALLLVNNAWATAQTVDDLNFKVNLSHPVERPVHLDFTVFSHWNQTSHAWQAKEGRDYGRMVRVPHRVTFAPGQYGERNIEVGLIQDPDYNRDANYPIQDVIGHFDRVSGPFRLSAQSVTGYIYPEHYAGAKGLNALGQIEFTEQDLRNRGEWVQAIPDPTPTPAPSGPTPTPEPERQVVNDTTSVSWEQAGQTIYVDEGYSVDLKIITGSDWHRFHASTDLYATIGHEPAGVNNPNVADATHAEPCGLGGCRDFHYPVKWNVPTPDSDARILNYIAQAGDGNFLRQRRVSAGYQGVTMNIFAVDDLAIENDEELFIVLQQDMIRDWNSGDAAATTIDGLPWVRIVIRDNDTVAPMTLETVWDIKDLQRTATDVESVFEGHETWQQPFIARVNYPAPVDLTFPYKVICAHAGCDHNGEVVIKQGETEGIGYVTVNGDRDPATALTPLALALGGSVVQFTALPAEIPFYDPADEIIKRVWVSDSRKYHNGHDPNYAALLLKIVEDDLDTQLSVNTQTLYTQEGIPFKVKFEREGDVSQEVTFQVRLTGQPETGFLPGDADLKGNNQHVRSVTFAPGEDTAMMRVNTFADFAAEGNETIRMDIQPVSGMSVLNAQHDLVIQDGGIMTDHLGMRLGQVEVLSDGVARVPIYLLFDQASQNKQWGLLPGNMAFNLADADNNLLYTETQQVLGLEAPGGFPHLARVEALAGYLYLDGNHEMVADESVPFELDYVGAEHPGYQRWNNQYQHYNPALQPE